VIIEVLASIANFDKKAISIQKNKTKTELTPKIQAEIRQAFFNFFNKILMKEKEAFETESKFFYTPN
jgi:hypothetical protein